MLEAFNRRILYYAVFSVVFAALYTGVFVALEGFPTPLLFGVLGVSLLKDVYDEYRIRRGRGPLAFVAIEHLPSNLVLIAFVLTGVVEPTGTLAVEGVAYTLTYSELAIGLAVFDTLLDLSQDLREA